MKHEFYATERCACVNARKRRGHGLGMIRYEHLTRLSVCEVAVLCLILHSNSDSTPVSQSSLVAVLRAVSARPSSMCIIAWSIHHIPSLYTPTSYCPQPSWTRCVCDWQSYFFTTHNGTPMALAGLIVMAFGAFVGSESFGIYGLRMIGSTFKAGRGWGSMRLGAEREIGRESLRKREKRNETRVLRDGAECVCECTEEAGTRVGNVT